MQTSSDTLAQNPLDLVLQRVVDVPSERVWAAWTEPALLLQWFTPAPWKTVACEIDLRPGGIFSTQMRGPEGQEFNNVGCYLEIVEGRKLVWTGALGPGFRPLSKAAQSQAPFLMTAVIALEPLGAQTRYTATVLHGDANAYQAHNQMGFHVGWGKALDQLVALVSTA